jgi:hypothetical protein
MVFVSHEWVHKLFKYVKIQIKIFKNRMRCGMLRKLNTIKDFHHLKDHGYFTYSSPYYVLMYVKPIHLLHLTVMFDETIVHKSMA